MRLYKNKNLIYAFICFLVAIFCCQSMAMSIVSNPMDATFNVPGLKPEVLSLAVTAYNKSKANGIVNKDLLTVVDYSMPSTARRLWVIDMRTKEVLYNTLVAHGKGSGNNYATQFSNRHGSRMSSLGVFLATDIYQGHYGSSLNMIGLEEKFNSNAEARRIVFHRAHYVDESIIKQIGRLGRSFGCLALNYKVADKIINTIKGGSLVFCYYPDPKWLNESKFL